MKIGTHTYTNVLPYRTENTSPPIPNLFNTVSKAKTALSNNQHRISPSYFQIISGFLNRTGTEREFLKSQCKEQKKTNKQLNWFSAIWRSQYSHKLWKSSGVASNQHLPDLARANQRSRKSLKSLSVTFFHWKKKLSCSLKQARCCPHCLEVYRRLKLLVSLLLRVLRLNNESGEMAIRL